MKKRFKKTQFRKINKDPNHPAENYPGMVLIIVLVVVFMLSFAGFSFVNALFTENKAAHLRQEEIQVNLTLDSAEEAIKVLVQYPLERHEDFGGIYNNAEIFRGKTLLEEVANDDSPKINTGRFSIISPRIEEAKVAGIRFGLVNESTKLNLLVLNQWEKKVPGSGSQALMNLPGMTEPIANSIMDWIDEDSSMREGGAESDFYESVEPGYTARNQIPQSLEELLLVKDVTRSLLFGIDQNYNYLIEEFEKESQKEQSGLSSEENGIPWYHYLTIYSAEKNLNTKGKELLDINSSDLKKLFSSLEKQTDKKMATFIVAYRMYGPYEGSGEVKEDYSKSLDFNKKPEHQFKTLLELIGAQVGIPAGNDKTIILKSPLVESLEDLKKKLPELADKLTVDSLAVIPGRININRSPSEILLGIPGITETLTTQIMAAREQENSNSEVSRYYPFWMYLEEIIDLKTMKEILPHITTGGDVYRAQIVGFYDNAGPSSRGEVIIDATKSPPQRIYWKDLQILGKGFPDEILGVVKDELMQVQ